MFLNQTQPRSLLTIIKEYIAEGSEIDQVIAPQSNHSSLKSGKLDASLVYANRVMEIEHKQMMIGLGMGGWK